MLSIKLIGSDEYRPVKDEDEFWERIHIYNPMCVLTQDEKDYLLSVALLRAKRIRVITPNEGKNMGVYYSQIRVDLNQGEH